MALSGGRSTDNGGISIEQQRVAALFARKSIKFRNRITFICSFMIVGYAKKCGYGAHPGRMSGIKKIGIVSEG
jgi:hypothetical protein